MQFLADESCDFSVVRTLRAARVLLTEDKDFGQLVFAGSHSSSGVILIRFPAEARPELPSTVLQTVERFGESLKGSFVVIQPNRVRISRIPVH